MLIFWQSVMRNANQETPEDYDKIVSAEIPNADKFP